MRFGGLIAAIVFAAIAAVIVLRMSANDSATPMVQAQPMQAQVAQAPVLKTTNVFVAATPIPIGASITQDMVAIQPWPEHLVLDGFIRADKGLGAVLGTIARTPFQPQEPIISSKLANKDDPNFMAGMLPKGMRVITIQTNEIEGIAGFVYPGDHVDVIVTHEVEKYVVDPGGDGTPRVPHKERDTVTESLLNNVKVLAVDQRATGAAPADASGRAAIPRSVSLMVTPADAQRVRLAAQKGTLTLQLRSIADRDSVDPALLTTAKDISQVPPADATYKAGPGTAAASAGPSVSGPMGDSSTVTVVRGISSAAVPVGTQPATNQPRPTLQQTPTASPKL